MRELAKWLFPWLIVAAFAAAGGYFAVLKPIVFLKALALGLANAAHLIPLMIFTARR